MKRLKMGIRGLARRIGFDIIRFRKEDVGVNPFIDMQRFLGARERPVIFDVGANVGQSVGRFLEAFPASSLHSFEPSPSTYLKLKSYCDKLAGVKAWNFGVGSSDATLTFHENDQSYMSSFLPPGVSSWGHTIQSTEVNVITIDSFSKKNNIDFIHILKSDTQGYDLEVFKGASRMMKENRIGLIYFEFIFSEMYKGLPSFYEVFRYLDENNFALVAFYEQHFQGGLVGWTDALCINRDYNLKRAGRGAAADVLANKAEL